ncbi:hypothetical protein B296_00027433, partial [Ensete ventricosum]
VADTRTASYRAVPPKKRVPISPRHPRWRAVVARGSPVPVLVPSGTHSAYRPIPVSYRYRDKLDTLKREKKGENLEFDVALPSPDPYPLLRLRKISPRGILREKTLFPREEKKRLPAWGEGT